MRLRIVLILLAVLAFYAKPETSTAAVNGGAVVTTARTNTSILITISTAATEVDSVYACYIEIAGSDTVFTAIDSTYTSVVLSGLDPNFNAEYFVLARDTNSDTAISDKDTVRTYSPEKESGRGIGRSFDTERVVTATSWRPFITETFTISGTLQDSSGHYEPWDNNSLTVIASQDGDSVGVMLYIWYGYRDMNSQRGETFGFAASVDSMDINAPGTFGKTMTANVGAPTMYYKLEGYVTNGKDTSIDVYLTRRRNSSKVE